MRDAFGRSTRTMAVSAGVLLCAHLGCAATATAAPNAVAAGDEGVAAATRPPIRAARYRAMVERVAAMPGDERVVARAGRFGLHVLNVLWEDTGRYEGSSVGPNISDVTIEVEAGDGRTALMPVLRHPNFSDKTADLPLDAIWLTVGNHVAGDARAQVTLREFLAEPSLYMSHPDAGRIRGGSLLAARDSHALVSAQATFLPIPHAGQATFWPVIFNYQSTAGAPAVLTLLVTRQGTSLTVIDNARDSLGHSWGQRLFFNKAGRRAPLTAERLSTVQANGHTANGEAASSIGEDANVLMIVQVPLKVRPRRMAMPAPMAEMAASAGAGTYRKRAAESDVEMAVLGHGPVLGPFSELDELTIERDPRFPVRVTVQFYQATSRGRPTTADIRALAEQIGEVYRDADHVGSLVVASPADRVRPTAWHGMRKPTAAPRCADFPGLVERGICALENISFGF